MAEKILVIDENQNQAFFECKWDSRSSTDDNATNTAWQSIDLYLKLETSQTSYCWPSEYGGVNIAVQDDSQPTNQVPFFQDASSEVIDLFLKALSKTREGADQVIRLIVPSSAGYIVRSDIVELRLLGCSVADAVASLAVPLQHFDGQHLHIQTLQDVSKAFRSCAGAIVLNAFTSLGFQDRKSQLSFLDDELSRRLSFPWISKNERTRKTLALVEGGRRSPDKGGNGSVVFQAAKAMGIDMVVLDNPGHWLDGPRWASWRKEFIPIECTLQSDAVFTKRVVDALRAWSGHIDGLVTFRDHYKEPVAEAALLLNLPTIAPESFALATDKFRLRKFEGHEAYVASSFEEATKIIQDSSLDYPLIMKPCTGYLSEGVFRLENIEQLRAGVASLDHERHGPKFAIEKYCDGPEVDANFVICNDDLLFFEASDEFPKSADINGAGDVKTFIELGNVLPSGLPQDELDVLKNSLHQSLLRLGFHDGIYHLEARVDRSRMGYAIQDGVLDLALRSATSDEVPSAWLIEVNPRPPGMQASEASKYTYGIDYWALGLLFALEDRQRARQLSYPFSNGAQYWCEMVFIPAERGGTFTSEDSCAELFGRRPDLAAAVSWSQCFFQRGEQVPDPVSGINCWIAHFNVFSRISRKHAIELAELVRSETRFSIE